MTGITARNLEHCVSISRRATRFVNGSPGTRAKPLPSPILPPVEIGVLGPAEARRDGALVDLGARKQRALLCALALYRGWCRLQIV